MRRSGGGRAVLNGCLNGWMFEGMFEWMFEWMDDSLSLATHTHNQ
jgi:hypothetical protein